MSVYDDFTNTYPVGAQLDTDGFPSEQPFQCFDGALVYVRMVAQNNGLYIRCGSSGYVKDWWNDFASNGLSQWFDQIPWDSKGQRGDIGLWGNAPATPYSHVAMIESDNGNTQTVFGQNQPKPYMTRISITSNGLLGYLRPKQQTEESDMKMTRDLLYWHYQLLAGREPYDGEYANYVGKDYYWVTEEMKRYFANAGYGYNAYIERTNNDIKIKDEALASVTAQVSSAIAERDQIIQAKSIEDTKLASMEKTIADLNAVIDDLKKKPVEPPKPTAPTTPVTPKPAEPEKETGSAGVKPTPPIEYTYWAELGDYVKNMFKK